MNTQPLVNPPKGRILAIDFLKALAIILVVFSHINAYNGSAKIWTICFAPNVFFFSHGVVCRSKIHKLSDWKDFILNRIVSILTPYLIWGMIYSPLTAKNIVKLCYGSHESLSLADSLTSLWFLPCLFAGDLLFALILWAVEQIKSPKGRLIFLTAVVAGILAVCPFLPHFAKGWPFGADVALQAVAWIGLGYLTMYLLKDRINPGTGKQTHPLVLVLIAAAGLALSLTAFCNTSMPGGYVMMAEARYGNYLLYLASAAGGTAFVFALSFLLARIRNRFFVRSFQLIGQSTMVIFAVHKFVIKTLQNVLTGIAIPHAAAAAVILITSIGISLCVMPFINTYLPLLAGKMKYKKVFGET